MTYRVNGRATQADEKILRNLDRNEFNAQIKSANYFIDDKEVTPKKKYNELKAIFDEFGWSAFDKEQGALFDDLNSVYGATPVDTKDDASTLGNLDVLGDSDRTESAHYLRLVAGKLGWNVTVLGDGISVLKCCSGGVWHDAFSTNVILASPSNHRVMLNEWRLKFPEEDFPDYRADGSGIIPCEWTPPRKKSTKHAAIAEELKIVLAYYHALRDSNEQVQTNFFIGDNDNAPKEDDNGDAHPPLNAAGEWEIRPSIKETMRAALLPGVEFKTRLAFTDSLGNHRPAMVVPVDGPDIERDSKSRTVTEIERAQGEPIVITGRSSSPVCRIGELRFATSDYNRNIPDSKCRGELLTADGYQARDRALKPKKSSAGQKEEDNRRRAELSSVPETPTRVKELPAKEKAKQRVNKPEKIKPNPMFFTASMPLNEARAIHGVSPANDNQVYSGLPWRLPGPDYLVTKANPLLADSPEEFLIENEARLAFCKAKSELSPDEIRALDSPLAAENFAKVGRKTGDEGKHERTQERNGLQRVLAVAAKLSAKIAA